MTHHVEDSVIATFARLQHVWMELVRKGYLDPVRAARAVQALVEQRNGERFIVDYGMSLKQMIALGRYGWEDSSITAERFPIVGAGVVECEYKLFSFGYPISFGDAVWRIVANGWQPGKIEHLLAFGAAKPDEQLIVALGSLTGVGEARLASSIVGSGGGRRGLSLNWCNLGFTGGYRFLAVRPPAPADS